MIFTSGAEAESPNVTGRKRRRAVQRIDRLTRFPTDRCAEMDRPRADYRSKAPPSFDRAVSSPRLIGAEYLFRFARRTHLLLHEFRAVGKRPAATRRRKRAIGEKSKSCGKLLSRMSVSDVRRQIASPMRRRRSGARKFSLFLEDGLEDEERERERGRHIYCQVSRTSR